MPGTVAWTVEGNTVGPPQLRISAAQHAVEQHFDNQHGIHRRRRRHVVTDNVAVDNSVVGVGARDGIRISGTSGNTVTGNRTGSTGTALQGYGILLLERAEQHLDRQSTTGTNAGLVIRTGNTLTGNR